ncbi:hypothetical protein FGRMN_2742 [Fusarium graminum]|nr:hypothetical protein FGRMN_2742 [Fusarium graminum]
MLLRNLSRNLASRTLARPPLECQFRQQPQFLSICAFSTTPTNRRANASSPRDSTAPGERPARVVKTSTTSKKPAEIEKKLQAHAAKLAKTREEQLREARQRRANRISEEKTKKAEVEAEETGERELTKEEKERKEKEDYKKRYKQLERNWIKFMVGMPVFLVMSYDLFQRLVMKREQKVPPWKQARLNKEKEEREKQESKRLTEGEKTLEG